MWILAGVVAVVVMPKVGGVAMVTMQATGTIKAAKAAEKAQSKESDIAGKNSCRI